MLLCSQPWVTRLAALIILLGMLGDPGKSLRIPSLSACKLGMWKLMKVHTYSH